MGAKRNETDITVLFAARFMISTDDAEASILSSCSRVRLESRRVETGYFAEILFEFLPNAFSAIKR
jgi:hypothetical protein